MKVAILLSVFVILGVNCVRYEPNWASIDSRPLPTWYDDAKIGMFINWGVYSVPAVHDEWFWYWWKGPNPTEDVTSFMKKNYPPDFTYADFASQFKAEFYDPNQWKAIIQASGVQYVVLATKHCEGFSMYPSKYSFNWNSQEVGPKQDLVGPLADAIRGTGIHFGIYHALLEWFHPLFLEDKKNNYTTRKFALEKAIPEIYEIVRAYKPDIFWSDADWLSDDVIYSDYWNSTEFLAWLYNDSPVKDTVVTNDRWGRDATCKHGGFWTCQDRYHPGQLQPHKWENAMTIDRVSWGFRRNADLAAFLSIEELLEDVISTVSYGGNILINVGPTSYGTFAPIYEERFRQLGSWLRVNGEGIFFTTHWTHQNDSVTPRVWYTNLKSSQKVVYALFMKWPTDNQLILGSVDSTKIGDVELLGSSSKFTWMAEGSGTKILFPQINVANMPCLWAWTFRIIFKS